ncbi:hypothetical protein [Aquirufa sp. A-Brett2-W8]
MNKILFFLLTLVAFTARSQEDYADFYAKREASLKSETGWLNLAGLFGLKREKTPSAGRNRTTLSFHTRRHLSAK